MYCEKCHVITEHEACSSCNGSAHLREPQAEDQCFLIITDYYFGETLADMLRKNQIPFFLRCRSVARAKSCILSVSKQIKFYVPYARYKEANDLTNALYAEMINIEDIDLCEEE